MFISLKLASVAALLALVSAAPAESFEKRATVVLADGNSVKAGTLPNYSFIYRASGYLSQGCPAGSGISTCYNFKLSADPTKNIDPDESSGTQKIQDVLLSSPSIPATGTVVKHTFKVNIGSSLSSTTANSFPLVQLVSKEVPNGAATTVSLDLKNNKAGIYFFSDSPSVSVPLSKIVGRTTTHTWTIKGGPNGYANVTVTDSATGAVILYYNAVGQNSWDSYRLRVGTRRVAETGMKALDAFWGDYVKA